MGAFWGFSVLSGKQNFYFVYLRQSLLKFPPLKAAGQNSRRWIGLLRPAGVFLIIVSFFPGRNSSAQKPRTPYGVRGLKSDSLLDHGRDLGGEVVLLLLDALAGLEPGVGLDGDLAAQLLGNGGDVLLHGDLVLLDEGLL